MSGVKAALERLYIKYRLRETRGDDRELRRRGEADLVLRIVVSEAVGRGRDEEARTKASGRMAM